MVGGEIRPYILTTFPATHTLTKPCPAPQTSDVRRKAQRHVWKAVHFSKSKGLELTQRSVQGGMAGTVRHIRAMRSHPAAEGSSNTRMHSSGEISGTDC